MRVKLLPDNLINQISAGEVIDRPSSVVRELVDNAIDAKATKIEVFLEDGGKDLIRVVDNGFGMKKDDALMAFERHATSKISSQEELYKINSLGFRGEALPSIASVSNVYLKSREENEETATVVEFQAGKLKNVQNSSGQQGTIIEIGSLFYNTPARKKFLKTDKTEERRVKNWIKQTALAYPKVHFKLHSANKEILNFSPKEDVISRARDLFSKSSVELSYRDHDLKIKGLLSHPSMSQRTRDGLTILVNGRVVSDKLILKAVKEGFSSTLKYQEFPVGFIDLHINPELVDVNVHPQKSEVRFVNPQKIFLSIRDSVHSAINEFKAPVSAEFSDSFKKTVYPQSSISDQNTFSFPLVNKNTNFEFVEPTNSNAGIESQSDFKFVDLIYIGQAFNCYLFCEREEELFIVDMHAAHERYNFNLVRNNFNNKTPDAQILLLPKTVKLTEQATQNCLSHCDLLLNFGLGLEQCGEDSVIITSVPSIMSDKNVTDLVKDLSNSEYLSEAEAVLNKAVDYISARIACHASIRSGDKLSKADVYALFKSLDSSEFSSACPHGRPVVIRFDKVEIEKWFGRI